MKEYGEWRYSSTIIMTSVLDGEVNDQLHVCDTLILGMEPPVPTGQEAGWDPEQVWTL
jgi:hypothetical protein